MVLTALLGLVFALQTAASPQATPARSVGTARKPVAAAQSELRQRGRRLLETAEGESSGITEPVMRGYALLQVARVYGSFDRKKALDLLNDAFNAAAGLPDDAKAKPRLAEQILEAMAGVDPQRADELLAQAPSESREGTLHALLAYYKKNNQFDRAMDVVERVAADGAFPYTAANKLMDSLRPDSADERQRVFRAALESFRAEKPPEGYAGPGGDFGEMVVQQYQTLPAPLVREAIDELLRKAESPDGGSMEMTMIGQRGSLAFNSRYEWRLFQLLPVLRRIDESAAEALLKKNQGLDAQFQRYPRGMESWQVEKDQPSINGVVVTARDSTGPRNTPPAPPPRVFQMMQMIEQMNRVLRDVKDHPHEALAQALAMQDASTRLRTLILVARATQKKNTSVCKRALDQVVEQIDQIELQEQVNTLVDAGRLYVAISESDGIKTVLQRGFAVADKLYKTDTNLDDPNRAPKAYWPSTNAWTNFVRLGAEVSPDATLQMVNQLADEEIRPAIRTALASAWLGAPNGSSLIMRDTKSGTRTLDGRGGDEEGSNP